MIRATREGQGGASDAAERFDVDDGRPTGAIIGGADVDGQPEALAAKLAERLARNGLGPFGPVKIVTCDRSEVVFEAAGLDLGSAGYGGSGFRCGRADQLLRYADPGGLRRGNLVSAGRVTGTRLAIPRPGPGGAPAACRVPKPFMSCPTPPARKRFRRCRWCISWPPFSLHFFHASRFGFTAHSSNPWFIICHTHEVVLQGTNFMDRDHAGLTPERRARRIENDFLPCAAARAPKTCCRVSPFTISVVARWMLP